MHEKGQDDLTMSVPRKPTLVHALIPIVFLVGMLIFNVIVVYGDDSLGGANQMALLLSAAVAALVGASLGFKWDALLGGIVKSISSALGALVILLLIGSLAGTWLLSGVVPAMIYYGLDILNPTIFLFASCFVCALVSLATGSSWSTVATVGIALLGIGKALGIQEGIIAGAIISGAYFGDKMSPLSDTTNLAPAMAGTDLITHIRYMALTTGPSILITLIIFLIWGFFIDKTDAGSNVTDLQEALAARFNITPWLFIVPLAVIGLIVMKVKAIPALFCGVLLGGLFAVVFQKDIVGEVGHRYMVVASADKQIEDLHFSWNNGKTSPSLTCAGEGSYRLSVRKSHRDIGFVDLTLPGYGDEKKVIAVGKQMEMPDGGKIQVTISAKPAPYIYASYISVMEAMTRSISLGTGHAKLDELLEQDGMFGMMKTVWLIICAMTFGGVMEITGLLRVLANHLLHMAKNTGSLIATTAMSCIVFNLTASDQYLAIVVPGRMFAGTFRDRKLHPKVLSRTLEDSGTVTSALVPWNTCGAYHSGVLGVATGDYFMYAFFNLISPLMTMLFGFAGIRIAYLDKKDESDRSD